MVFAADVATCIFSVPTLILLVLVSNGPCGAFCAIYRYVAPESTIPVCSGSRVSSFSSYIYGLLVGLHIKLSSCIKFSL